MSTNQLNTFICVHKRDVGYLFEMVLRSYLLNFEPKGNLTVICNDLPFLRDFLAEKGLDGQVSLSGDADWLSQREMALPGWYKQQVIKLRSYEFTTSDNFVNLGADTVILQKITAGDLVENERPILYYTRHLPPNQHYLYEAFRVFYTSRILQVKPLAAARYVDFISDLFCFNRQELLDLNRHLQKLYGDNYFAKIIEPLGTKDTNQKKFGEWTLYNVFVLDYLKQKRVVRRSNAGFQQQVRDKEALNRFGFDTKVAHFVGKDFDPAYISNRMIERKLELGNYFVEAKDHVLTGNS